MTTYFDTSYLVALYVPNDHTAAALRYRARRENEPIPFNPLHRLELRTTVRQCAHAAFIKESDGRRILRSIEEDLDDGTLEHAPLDWTASLRRAETIAQRWAWSTRCRSLDLWHIAAAVEAKATLFLTFDEGQCELAGLAGLKAAIPH